MSQYDFGTIVPSTESGTDLAGDLNSWRDAIHSGHKGASRPSYATAGTLWIDDASNPIWKLKCYDGADDITISEIDSTNNTQILQLLVGTNGFTMKYNQTDGKFEVSAAGAGASVATPMKITRADGTFEMLAKLWVGAVSGSSQGGKIELKDDINNSADTLYDATPHMTVHNDNSTAGARALLRWKMSGGEYAMFGVERKAEDTISFLWGFRTSGGIVDDLLELTQDRTLRMDGALRLKENASSFSHLSGWGTIYYKTDGLLYFKDESGTEYDLTSGGGPSLGTDSIIRTNGATISEDITIPSGTNGMTAGPVTIADGYTVTVNGNWSVV